MTHISQGLLKTGKGKMKGRIEVQMNKNWWENEKERKPKKFKITRCQAS